eukprot:g16747.t1
MSALSKTETVCAGYNARADVNWDGTDEQEIPCYYDSVSDRLEFRLNRFMEDISKVLGEPISPSIFDNQTGFGRERDRLKEVYTVKYPPLPAAIVQQHSLRVRKYNPTVDDDGNKVPGQSGKRKTGPSRFPHFLTFRQLWAVYLLQSNNPQRV